MKNKKLKALLTIFVILLPFIVSAQMTTVKGDRVNSRKGPGTKYAIQWEYGNGLPLEVVEHNQNWIKVKDFENDIGWIHKSLLHNEPHVIVKVNKNTSKKVNIRKSPSIKSEIVGEAFYGVVFKTLEKKQGWVKVQHETGLTGWINEKLLWGY